MSSIAALASNHSVTLPVDAEEATPTAQTAFEPVAPSSMPETSMSSLASAAPLGGLHPIAHEPGTAIFGFITKAWQEVQSKEDPSSSDGPGLCGGLASAMDRSGITELNCRANQYASLGS